MKILIVKLSSLGDVIHTLPILADLKKHLPTAEIDWAVEPAFAEILTWHPAVSKVIAVPLRQWRKNIFKLATWKNIKQSLQNLRLNSYDLIIDAQGLLKSAIITKLARGYSIGYDRQAAREKIASAFYNKTIFVPRQQHAIERTRQLVAKHFNYALEPKLEYGLGHLKKASRDTTVNKSIILLHGTTWDTKHWPEIYWRKLIETLADHNYQIQLPWGNAVEFARAERLTAGIANAHVLPKSTLTELAQLIGNAKAVVAVDSGLAHLSAALDVLTVSIYGPTNPLRTGTRGQHQMHLAAQFQCAPCLLRQCKFKNQDAIFPPCYQTITPAQVLKELNL